MELWEVVLPFLEICNEMQNNASSEAPVPPETFGGTAQAKQGEGTSFSSNDIFTKQVEDQLKEELDQLRSANRRRLQENARLLDQIEEGIERLEAQKERLKAENALKDEEARKKLARLIRLRDTE